MTEHRLEVPLESPEDDLTEQLIPIDPDEDEVEASDDSDEPLEVDPADRADQQRSVDLDDDEYR
jgi:hypothetical protein